MEDFSVNGAKRNFDGSREVDATETGCCDDDVIVQLNCKPCGEVDPLQALRSAFDSNESCVARVVVTVCGPRIETDCIIEVSTDTSITLWLQE